MRILNEPLYDALRRTYSDVTIHNPGQQGNFVRRVVERNRDGRTRRYVRYELSTGGLRGEQYSFRCPYCQDHKPRLRVGYLFGTFDQETGSRYLSDWVCYNEDCQTIYDNTLDLWNSVDVHIRYSDKDVSGKVRSVVTTEQLVGLDHLSALRLEVGKPGICRDLRTLVPGTRAYRAVEYLEQDRKFDINVLSEHYAVEYLETSPIYAALADRIFTPFFRNGVMFAWTTRAVEGLCSSEQRHYHSPGGLGGILYGLGSAVRQRCVVLVEGTADRWAVGDSSVAILNKRLSASSYTRLLVGLNSSPVEIVLVALDPQKSSDYVAKNKIHHIEEACSKIKAGWSGIVLPCYLPITEDPASLGGVQLARFFYEFLRQRGFEQGAEVLARNVWDSTATRK